MEPLRLSRVALFPLFRSLAGEVYDWMMGGGGGSYNPDSYAYQRADLLGVGSEGQFLREVMEDGVGLLGDQLTDLLLGGAAGKVAGKAAGVGLKVLCEAAGKPVVKRATKKGVDALAAGLDSAPRVSAAAKTIPNPRTGVGYGVTDPPVRIQGTWTEADFKAALQGRPPPSLGRPDLHHAGQMPGSAIHEVLPDAHRGNPALHPNRFNQGVTPQMRNQDRQLYWWYRAREQGADRLYPDLIYDP